MGAEGWGCGQMCSCVCSILGSPQRKAPSHEGAEPLRPKPAPHPLLCQPGPVLHGGSCRLPHEGCPRVLSYGTGREG